VAVVLHVFERLADCVTMMRVESEQFSVLGRELGTLGVTVGLGVELSKIVEEVHPSQHQICVERVSVAIQFRERHGPSVPRCQVARKKKSWEINLDKRSSLFPNCVRSLPCATRSTRKRKLASLGDVPLQREPLAEHPLSPGVSAHFLGSGGGDDFSR
jgi:hypothetical protein